MTLPTARVWVSRGLEQKPFLEGEAKLERIGVAGGAEADVTHIYVSRLTLPEPGTYWLVAEPEGGAEARAGARERRRRGQRGAERRRRGARDRRLRRSRRRAAISRS